MSNMMKAVVVPQPGGPEAMQMGEVARPTPGPEQLLVRVRATALNRADTLQRAGKYPPPPGESAILGLELAGEVEAWGDSVQGFSKGQRICALVGGGGYAQYALVDAQMAIPMPEHWDFTFAAAIPEVFMTANEAVFWTGGLQAGETLLVHAGASGVGTTAIQLAKKAGAKVLATAGSAAKLDVCQSLGAEVLINYKEQDFAQAVLEATNGQGVNQILDFVGGDYFERNLKALAIYGRMTMLAVMGGAKAELFIPLLMSKRLQINGFVLRARSLEEKRTITQRLMQRWGNDLNQGIVKPIIDKVFDWSQVAEAHRYMEENRNIGKIVMAVD